MQCLLQMNKINYYEKSIEEIEKIKLLKQKPSILIHACCAPCSAFPLEFLTEYFDVTIYYNNSNIYPEAEYYQRLNELKDFLKTDHPEVKIIIPKYENEKYNKMLSAFGAMPEGRERCFACYSFRMNQGYKFAFENNFDYYTTIMTISRHKNSQKLNEIGSQLEKKYPKTKYFYSDFKKKQGLEKGNKIAREHDMYRQDYCGCVYSYNARNIIEKENDNE